MKKRRNAILKSILCLAVLGVVVLSGMLFLLRQENEAETPSVSSPLPTAEPTREPEAGPTPEPSPAPTEVPVPTEIPAAKEGMEELKSILTDKISGYEGTWSLYVENLDDGEYLSVNNAPMKAASLIKLYIMGAVLDAKEAGTLEMTEEIRSLLTNMITVSHNESSNELVRRLSPDGSHEAGMPVVNAFAAENGYTDTSQGRDLQDWRETPPPGENYTSVKDCGRFLASVYRRECVSEEASIFMEDLLKRQERIWKIPAGLPEGVRSANKTGELSDVENDTAIVFGREQGAKDYVFCVMTQDLPDTQAAQIRIQELSGIVYGYFS